MKKKMHIADISQSFSWTHFCMCKLLIRIKIICNTGNIIPDSFSFFFSFPLPLNTETHLLEINYAV